MQPRALEVNEVPEHPGDVEQAVVVHPRNRIGLGVERCPEGVLRVQIGQQLARPADEHRCEIGVQLAAGASAHLLDGGLVTPHSSEQHRGPRDMHDPRREGDLLPARAWEPLAVPHRGHVPERVLRDLVQAEPPTGLLRHLAGRHRRGAEHGAHRLGHRQRDPGPRSPRAGGDRRRNVRKTSVAESGLVIRAACVKRCRRPRSRRTRERTPCSRRARARRPRRRPGPPRRRPGRPEPVAQPRRSGARTRRADPRSRDRWRRRARPADPAAGTHLQGAATGACPPESRPRVTPTAFVRRPRPGKPGIVPQADPLKHGWVVLPMRRCRSPDEAEHGFGR